MAKFREHVAARIKQFDAYGRPADPLVEGRIEAEARSLEAQHPNLTLTQARAVAIDMFKRGELE